MLSFPETLQYLDSLTDHSKNLHQLSSTEFSLGPLKEFLHSIGDPQKKLKVIHVAGSKGKGSISAMVASILRSAGYRVGLYTSPHLHDIRERIRVMEGEASSGETDDFAGMISEEDFCRGVTDLRQTLQEKGATVLVTYFEFLTAFAFHYFVDQEVDVAVVETGLGGRLDATNVVDAMVSVLTPISLEHTHILGNSVKQIAEEKAAIIKSSTKAAVVAAQEAEAMEVIRRRCHEVGVSLVSAGDRFSTRRVRHEGKGQTFDVITPTRTYQGLLLSLFGLHQIDNAAVAVAVCESLCPMGFEIGAGAVSQGLGAVRWPGRFEIVGQAPLVILDGAHNEASAQVLSKTLLAIGGGKKIRMVWGMLKDKDIAAFCRVMAPVVTTVIGTTVQHPRALELREEEIKNFFPGKEVCYIFDAAAACRYAQAAASAGDIVVVTGSLYLVAEARKIFINEPHTYGAWRSRRRT